MKFCVVNEPPILDKPYGVTRFRVNGSYEFTLTDVLERKDGLIAEHGEELRDLLDYIEGTLTNSPD